PSMSSFWMDCTSIVTPGLASSKAATVASQYALPGPVVELCQKVIVTSPSPDPPSPPPEQPAASRATVAPRAKMPVARVFLIIVEPLVGRHRRLAGACPLTDRESVTP